MSECGCHSHLPRAGQPAQNEQHALPPKQYCHGEQCTAENPSSQCMSLSLCNSLFQWMVTLLIKTFRYEMRNLWVVSAMFLGVPVPTGHKHFSYQCHQESSVPAPETPTICKYVHMCARRHARTHTPIDNNHR